MLKKIIPTILLRDSCHEYDELINSFFDCNIDTIRFNITRYGVERYIRDIKYISDTFASNNKNLFVLLDLPYPGKKIRTSVEKNIDIQAGNDYRFTFTKNCDDNLTIRIAEHIEKLYVNDKIILGDGELAFCIKEKEEDFFIATALNSETLRNGRAIYVSNRFIQNAKSWDNEYLKLISALNPDYIALSFVEEINDVLSFNERIQQQNPAHSPKIIAKIESQRGINNLRQILTSIDMVMIGRGDLAITTSTVSLGIYQDYIIKECNEYNVAVCVATDIMSSLTRNYIPTRSDILDLHHMLLQGIDYITLSAALSVNSLNIKRADSFIWEMNQLICTRR